MANTHQLRVSVQAANIGAGAGGDTFEFVITEATIAASSNPALFWSAVKADGGDLRAYTDDVQTVRLPVEIVSINTSTEKLIMWVSRAAVSSAVDTDIFLEFGDAALSQPAVGDAFGRNSVWTGWDIIVHGGTNVDSTGRYANGTLLGGLSTKVTGPYGWGEAYQLDGVDDGIEFASLGILEVHYARASLTIDATPTTNSSIFVRSTSGNSGMLIIADDLGSQGSANTFDMGLASTGERFDSGPNTATVGTTATLSVFSGATSGDPISYNLDGVPYESSPTGYVTPARSESYFIGGDPPNYVSVPVAGSVGECWSTESETIYNDAWDLALYLNQSAPDTFFDVGTVVVIGAPPAGFEPWFAVNSNKILKGSTQS